MPGAKRKELINCCLHACRRHLPLQIFIWKHHVNVLRMYILTLTDSAANGNCRGNIIADKINGLTRATKEGRKPSKAKGSHKGVN